MTVRQKELFRTIKALPDELSNKVMDYIEYLKFMAVFEKAPENLIVKSKQDLKDKLKVGIKDSDNGNVFSIEEVFSELDELLQN